MKNTIEVEVQGPKNESLHFRPLLRTIRGRLDLNAETEPLARMKQAEWPNPIPGQRLGLNLETGEGYIADPLVTEAEHAGTRDRIAARGMKLSAARESFPGVDVPTWLFWIKSAVEAGLARVVIGTLPDAIEGEPRRSFILSPRPPSREDRLVAALERQNDLIETLLAKLAKG